MEILPRDTTLRSYLDGYPAMWDGLVQLRIYLRAAGAPTNTSAYSATSLKVTGGRWMQVGPAAGEICGTSTPTSVLRLLGLPTTAPEPATSVSGPPAPDQPSAQPSTPAATTVRGATTPSASTTSVTTSASSPGSAADVSSNDVTASPVDPASSSNGVSRWLVVVATALLIALGAWFVRGKWGARDSS